MSKLTPKQDLTELRRRTVEEYFKMDSPDMGEAYRLAGGKGKEAAKLGSEILNYPECQEYLAQLRDQRTEQVQITAADVINDLIEVKDRCMQKVPVIIDDEIVQYRFEHSGANKSLELIGKHLRMWDDKQNDSGSQGNTVIINQIYV